MNRPPPNMAEALHAVLLFHSGDRWDTEKNARWLLLTGSEEATTKVLCDTVRAALADAAGRTPA